MADEKIRIDIEAKDDASKVIDKVADGAEALEKMNPEVEVKADADQAIGDMEQVEAAAKELSSADVEIVLQAKVDDLRQALNKAEGDLNAFQDKARGAASGVKDLGDKSDQSRSVMANMVGNTTQDLGELGGIAGSAGVAIGQIGEYAADGNIQMSKMVGMGVGLGVVAAVSAGIAGRMKDIAADKAFNKERVEGFAEALKDGADAAEAMAEHFEDAGKIELRMLGDTHDVTGALAEVGISVDQFSQLAVSGTEDIEAWGEKMRAAGVDADTVSVVMAAASQSGNQMADAQEGAAISAEVFGESEEELAKKTEEATKKIEDQRDAANELVDADMAAADSAFAMRDAEADYNAATAETIALQKTGKASSDELAAAYRNEREQAISVADAKLRYAEDQAKANGTVLEANDRLEIYNDSLLDSARSATPEARAQIALYLADMNEIPLSKATEIVANADTDKAEADLKYVTRARTVVVRPTLDQASAIWFSKELRSSGGVMAGQQSVDEAVAAAMAPTFYSGGGAPVNVVMNVPNGVTPQGVVQEMENFVRRNGGTVRR